MVSIVSGFTFKLFQLIPLHSWRRQIFDHFWKPVLSISKIRKKILKAEKVSSKIYRVTKKKYKKPGGISGLGILGCNAITDFPCLMIVLSTSPLLRIATEEIYFWAGRNRAMQ